MSSPTVREMHHRAARLFTAADLDRCPGRARHRYRRARYYETRAASMIEPIPAHEPTRSILLQSAAACALHGEEPARSRRLIAEARRGFPPPRVEAELQRIEALLEGLEP